MVICLERGADLHMVQLMPLPLTVSCFSKIRIGFTCLVPAHPGSPGQRAVKRVCVISWCCGVTVPCCAVGLYARASMCCMSLIWSKSHGTSAAPACDVASDVVVLWLCRRFVTKSQGVLYESDLIQVGVKCEFRQHLARLSLFYGNKTNVALREFLPVISNDEPPLSNHILSTQSLCV